MVRCLPIVLVAALLTAGCAVTQPASQATGAASAIQANSLLAKPEGNGPFPAVILLHTCGGVLPHVSRDWPQFLRSIGYVVLTIDSFGSRGMGRCPNGIVSPGQIRLDYVTSDAYAALDYLATLPFVDANRVAVVGFSLGAYAINIDMTPRNTTSPGQRQFKAAASLYGNCALTRGNAPRLANATVSPFPLLLLIPDHDERTVQTCALVSQPWIEKQVLVDAYHGFDHSNLRTITPDSFGTPMLHSAAATNQARQAVQVFLARNLARAPQ